MRRELSDPSPTVPLQDPFDDLAHDRLRPHEMLSPPEVDPSIDSSADPDAAAAGGSGGTDLVDVAGTALANAVDLGDSLLEHAGKAVEIGGEVVGAVAENIWELATGGDADDRSDGSDDSDDSGDGDDGSNDLSGAPDALSDVGIVLQEPVNRSDDRAESHVVESEVADETLESVDL